MCTNLVMIDKKELEWLKARNAFLTELEDLDLDQMYPDFDVTPPKRKDYE